MPNFKDSKNVFRARIVRKKTKITTKDPIFVIVLCLAGCGGGSSNVGSLSTAPAAGVLTNSMATNSDIAFVSYSSGVTPFISFVKFAGSSLASVQSVSYTIQPKSGTISKPVNVSYSAAALRLRGYMPPQVSTELLLPVFGLYAGYMNSVSVALDFVDGSQQMVPVIVTTAAYADPKGIYDTPVIVKQRTAGSTLGFDFFALKSAYGTPVIVDTDAEVRWVGQGVASSGSSIFVNNGFEVGDPGDFTVSRLELDGSVLSTPLGSTAALDFNHNIDPARAGNLLAEVTTTSNTGSTIAELFGTPTYGQPRAGFMRAWDFARILTDYMVSQGDDASAFVRPAVDWFHANAATYDPSDNGLIVSSRENFLMKVDYDSGNIIWIFGDPAKYWYTFPSLRAKALNLTAGGLYPIGQHATSLTRDGLLMVFNDGLGSLNQPKGAPAGESRSYSAVSAYAIDVGTMTATEVWGFDYGRSIYSEVCGSAYETPGQSILVDYASADNFAMTRLVGLDSGHNVVFDFQYSNVGCNTSWNAVPVNLDSMAFP